MNESESSTSEKMNPSETRNKRTLPEEGTSTSTNSSPMKMPRFHDDQAQMPAHTCEAKHLFINGNHKDEELCTACNTVAIQPYTVIECGHTYGKEVIDVMMKNGVREFPCVGDDIDSDDVRPCRSIIKLQDMKPNRAVEKGILKKMVYCPNKRDGCEKVVKLRNEENHLRECPFPLVKCQSCSQMISRGTFAAHKSNCAVKRLPLSVVARNPDSLSRDNVHSGGVVADIGARLALLFQNLSSIRSITGFRQRDSELTRQILESEGQEQDPEILNHMETELTELTEIKVQMESLKQAAGPHSKALSQLMHEDFAIIVAAAWQRQQNLPDLLHLNEELTNEAVGKHMELIQQVPTLISHGSVIFKVSNFTEKRTSAIQGILKKGIYGPPFFTHEYGYKMVPILYPNGDGKGFGTHLSIFLAVMMGPYDDMLKWPMKGKLTVSILSQNRGGREAVKHCFRTDAASLSYHRPSSEINQASGIPRALDLALLRQPSDYLVDDTLFIQFFVEALHYPDQCTEN